MAQNEHPAAQVMPTLDQALLAYDFFDLAVIASPSHLHASQAQKLLPRTNGLFVEKPLSHELDGLSDLCAQARLHEVISMVGCNMRFYPTLARMDAMVKQGLLGRPLYARLRFGQHLSLWRPKEDYRKCYSAQKDQGGGIILDDIHEIDLAVNMFGPMESFQVMGGHLSDLELDVEDFASINLETASGAVVQITMDYLHPAYQRQAEVVGTQGSLTWDEAENILWHIKAPGLSPQKVLELKNYDYHEIYIEETKHFLDCLARGIETVNNLEKAFEVLKLTLAIREQMRLEMKNA
jgi:predicted dehydrogenase